LLYIARNMHNIVFFPRRVWTCVPDYRCHWPRNRSFCSRYNANIASRNLLRIWAALCAVSWWKQRFPSNVWCGHYSRVLHPLTTNWTRRRLISLKKRLLRSLVL